MTLRSGGRLRAGYPRWSPGQWEQAYPNQVRPYLPLLFGTGFSQQPLSLTGFLVHHCLQPDLVVGNIGSREQPVRYGFAQNPAAALSRLTRFFTEVDTGSRRLRDLRPVALVDAGEVEFYRLGVVSS